MPLQRSLSASALRFSLTDEMELVRKELQGAPERIGRTLLKDGPLRVTLIGVKPGGGLRDHRADGPITVHVLEGAITMQTSGTSWPLAQGELMMLEAGVEHAVTSTGGGIFLLTVVAHVTPKA